MKYGIYKTYTADVDDNSYVFIEYWHVWTQVVDEKLITYYCQKQTGMLENEAENLSPEVTSNDYFVLVDKSFEEMRDEMKSNNPLITVSQWVQPLEDIGASGLPVGKLVRGMSFNIDGTEFIANDGAEIFNDYSNNIAIGVNSHAEGSNTIALGANSHAEGNGTKAYSNFQHVQGKYNVEDDQDKFAFIIGNGADNITRSNALTVEWNGDTWCAGNMTLGENNSPVVTAEHLNNELQKLVTVGTADPDASTQGLVYFKYLD